MEAGKAYEADVDLSSIAYIFPKGHRIRVTISSAAYPYFDANSNTGSPVAAQNVTAVAATNTIHMGPSAYLSQISLPVVKIDDIPQNKHFGDTFPGLAAAMQTLLI